MGDVNQADNWIRYAIIAVILMAVGHFMSNMDMTGEDVMLVQNIGIGLFWIGAGIIIVMIVIGLSRMTQRQH